MWCKLTTNVDLTIKNEYQIQLQFDTHLGLHFHFLYSKTELLNPVLVSFIIGLITLGMTNGSIVLFISAIFIGIGYGTVIPSAQAIAIQQSPKEKIGLATSTFYMFADLGAGIGPFILGFIIPFIGYRYLYIVMGLLVIVSLCVYYFVHGKKASQQQYNT